MLVALAPRLALLLLDGLRSHRHGQRLLSDLLQAHLLLVERREQPAEFRLVLRIGELQPFLRADQQGLLGVGIAYGARKQDAFRGSAAVFS